MVIRIPTKISYVDLLAIFIIFLPIVSDALTGVFTLIGKEIPFSTLVRGVIYLFGFLNILIILFRNRIHLLIPALLIFLALCLIWRLSSGGFTLSRELTMFFKITYFFTIVFLINEFNFSEKMKRYCLRAVGVFMSTLLIFSFFTNIGLSSYGDYAFGTSSFFTAQNDIGIILLMILTYFLFNIHTVNDYVSVVFMIIGLLLIGSITGLFGTFSVIFIRLIFYFFFTKKTSAFAKGVKYAIVIIVFSSLILLIKSTVGYIEENRYLLRKVTSIITEGPRAALIEKAAKIIDERETLANWIGSGNASFTSEFANSFTDDKKKGQKDAAFVESDYFDLVGSYGYILGGAIISFYFFTCLKFAYAFFKFRTKYLLSLTIIFFIAFLHGLLVGHVIITPPVNGILAVFFTFTNNSNA